jgi:hypothetical protein
MKFLKIKINKNEKVEMEYYTDTNEKNPEPALVRIKAPEIPHAGFLNAIHALRKYVIIICEQKDCNDNEIEMRGISFSYHDKQNARGFIFTALRSLENSHAPLLLNSPLKYDNTEDEKTCLPDGCLKAINKLEQEAIVFLRERNSQLSLFEKAA